MSGSPATVARQRMRRVTVDVRSPDGSVRAGYSATTGIRISLPVRHADEQRLSEQLTAALRGVDEGLRRAMDTVVGDGGPSPTREQAEQATRLRALLSTIAVRAESPRGHVTVTIIGDDHVSARVTPGTLSRLDCDWTSLTVEINSTVAKARAEHLRRKHADLQQFRRTIHRQPETPHE